MISKIYIIILNIIYLFLYPIGVYGNYLRPRGVSIVDAALYDPSEEFTCLDGSRSFQFKYVNDDYCDCLDGTDEPGTSACSNGRFHCDNLGYKSKYIPSAYVNDGFCDCCDASDEYNSTASCRSECKELGKKAYAEAKRQHELEEAGYKIKLEYSAKGKQLIEEKKSLLVDLEAQKVLLEAVKAEKQEQVSKAEEPEKAALEKYRLLEEEKLRQLDEQKREKEEEEARKAFDNIDLNKDGMLHTSEVQQQKVFDQDKNGEVSEQEAKFFFSNQEGMNFEEFLNTGWQLMKPYLHLKDTSSEEESSSSPSLSESHLPQKEELDEEEVIDAPPPPLPVASEEDIYQKYDEETQRLITVANMAREELENTSRILINLQDEIKNLNQFLNMDMGDSHQFVPLRDQCFEYKDQDYIYKLCLFKEVTQAPLTGGMETRLGSWSEWSGPEVDKYASMKYSHGAACWNGPHRSTQVHLICDVEDKITSVSEPSRCEYVFQFATVAACSPPKPLKDVFHDEL